MNSPLKTLIVDDEKEVRQHLRSLLAGYPQIEVVGEVGSVAEACAFLQHQSPALVFLDMEMPGGSGLELRQHLNKATRTVFVTAYPDYALNAFQFGAVDYLLKPVDSNRLAIAIERILDTQADMSSSAPQVLECFGISGQIERIVVADILWIESFQNYTRAYCIGANQPCLCRHTMVAWESMLSADRFVRVGRSSIVHSTHIRAMRWSSRDETLVSFIGSDQTLKLGRAASLRLKTHIRTTGSVT